MENTFFGFIFHFDKKSSLKVLSLISLSENKLTSIILMIMLFRSIEMAFPHDFKSEDLMANVKGTKYESILIKIISINSLEDRVEYIVSNFELIS